MTGRPEVLFKLFSDLQSLRAVGPKTVLSLAHLGIDRPIDLLMTLPHSAIDRKPIRSVSDVGSSQYVTVHARVEGHNAPKTKGRPYRILMRDDEAAFQLVFFHARGDYLKKLLPIGEKRIISGKLEVFDGLPQIVHPDYVVSEDQSAEIPELEPVYPLTSGVSQKTMQKATDHLLTMIPELEEWIDPNLASDRKWPAWGEAMQTAHRPKVVQEINADSATRQRLAYDEILAHQLTLAMARARVRRLPGISSVGNGKLQDRVLASLPFKPTNAQLRAVKEVVADLASEQRMNRLLQGDVGAGKTLVAFLALLAAVEAGGQGVLMAPTEILARQHFAGLQGFAKTADVSIALLTGRDRGQDREGKLDDLRSGRTDILIGTHAVFQSSVEFHALRLAIIDEQHRFGVSQRLQLGEKGAAVDVLVMTATPIPRSLALAQYGDMDVSILDEKPPGRTPVQTVLVSDERITEVVEKLRAAVAGGRQAYWVCPLVEESEVSELTAATERHDRLRARLGEDTVGLVHGQMPAEEKDEAMRRFVSGETAVLVATTVIEVGVDVPNASIMVIEGAESFGLSQLHQLRGRVGRGAAESSCLLLYRAPLSKTGRERLEIMRETEDGFRISEADLALRGAGDLIGTAQSGLPRFRIADLERHTALMQIAQKDARKLLHDDPKLESERGRAARTLLWLMQQEKAIRLISVG